MNLAAFFRAQARVARARAEAEAEAWERAAAELENVHAGMIDVRETPLGVRRGAARVRARIERGAPGAAIVGRRFYLSTEALAEELQAMGHEPKSQAQNDSDFLSETRAALKRIAS
jgi:hypothetical protein